MGYARAVAPSPAGALEPEARGQRRPLVSAELLSIGTELTVGETRDTNAGDIARDLTQNGVAVRRIQALPDDLDVVRRAFETALREVDLVVSTGGLGPTPDDLTREAIAAALDEAPTVDPEIEAWLRELWARRGMPFPELNLKQAWLLPSATAVPNGNGTAPGWWVDGPDDRVIVALPGPPREMRPMWGDWVLPRLHERGLGRDVDLRTLRLAGIGESQIADLLGALLTAKNPVVATYARIDAVDVRISATADAASGDRPARTAAEVADLAEAEVLARVGDHVWARGSTTWADAVGAELGRLGWTLAAVEFGTTGTLATLLAPMPALLGAEIRASDALDRALAARADAARAEVGATAAIAVAIRARGDDTGVTVAIVSPAGVHEERRVAFLGGAQGRHRAALSAADVLLRQLRQAQPTSGREAAGASR